jgi:hypothetical protein
MKLLKFTMHSGYAVFIVGALAFGLLTRPYEVTCPLDHGTGVIKGTTGLQIGDVGETLLKHRTFEMACATIWDEFTYYITVSLVNDSSSPGFGTIMVKFYDPTAIGKVYESMADALQQKSVEAEAYEETGLILTVETSTGGTMVTPVMSQRATKLVFFSIAPKSTKSYEQQITIMGWDWPEQSHIVTASLVNQTICPYCNGTGKLPVTEWLKIKAGVY